MIQLLLVEFQKHTYHLPTSVKPGFHMIATIAVIAEKKKVQRSKRSYGNHFLAIAGKWFPYDRYDMETTLKLTLFFVHISGFFKTL